jgi:hypothetical protein
MDDSVWLTEINEDLYEIIFFGLILFGTEVSMTGLCLLAAKLIITTPFLPALRVVCFRL